MARAFNLRARRAGEIRRWGSKIGATSLPSRVRHQMAERVKLERTWFSRFGDQHDGMTADGVIAPRHAETGFAMFVSVTYGNWNPTIVNDRIAVEVEVALNDRDDQNAGPHHGDQERPVL